jgi:hypothetical protein
LDLILIQSFFYGILESKVNQICSKVLALSLDIDIPYSFRWKLGWRLTFFADNLEI